ncbi:MAG: peptide deformylase [Coriobacteriales bacterium]|jgi:peptide deformylase|nr:peptide deformylase [Coriobacteriales bacterium]
MRVVLSPDPVLREKCEPVELTEIPKLRSTARQMAKVMYKNRGCGLAAPQVGITKRIIVVDCTPEVEGEPLPQNPSFYINPVITRAWGGESESEEGCLSIPGISVVIKRHNNIVVEALDLDGQPFTVEAEGFHARALQHELDHLDGKTMFEHLDPIDRINAFKAYEQALAEGAKPGDVG